MGFCTSATKGITICWSSRPAEHQHCKAEKGGGGLLPSANSLGPRIRKYNKMLVV